LERSFIGAAVGDEGEVKDDVEDDDDVDLVEMEEEDVLVDVDCWDDTLLQG
jgi:hypothetical protein